MKAPKSKVKRAKEARLALMLRDREDLLKALARGAVLTNELNALAANLNRELLATKERFAERAVELEDEKKAVESNIRTFVEMNRDELCGKRQSLEIAGHQIAFRDNGGSVATLPRCTQDGALDRLLACEGEDEAVAELFVTCKFSLNKEAIRKLYDEHEAFLKRMGLTLKHEESCTISYSLAPSVPVSAPVESAA